MAMTVEPEQSQATSRGSIPADSFANRLMLARAHAGHISIREAADLCDIGRGAWTNWEKGARPVDILDVAAVVGDKLGVDRNWLLFGGQLADVQPRPLRRSVIHDPNRSYGHVGRKDDPTPVRHVTPRPFVSPRRDPPRPVSAIPGTRRRPRDTRPDKRPMAMAS